MKDEKLNVYTVYKHTLPKEISGKENDMAYVGITMQQPEIRWGKNGRCYNNSSYFWNAIQKYGWNNIKHEILFVDLTKEEAEQKEVELIALHKSADRNFGYNISLGGFHNGKHSIESRIKISNAHKGMSYNIGRKHSEDAKLKISNANKGRHRSEEFKKRLSEAHLGKPKSEEFCKNLSDIKSIPVICIETKKVYKSATLAGRELGIDNSTISKCCKGDNKEAGGFHWMFADEYTEEKASEVLEKTRNNQHRQVICVDTRKIYDTIQSAALDVGVNGSEISACCRGTIMSAGQKRWLYLEDATEEKIQELLSIDISCGKPKPIYCVELNMIFKNAKEAGEYTGVISSNILAVCKGRKGHKTAGKLPDGTKLHWKYAT